MITTDMFLAQTCQAALFFSNNYQLSPLRVASSISEKLSGIFTVEPSTVPFPLNVPVPPEVPRVVLQGDKAGSIVANNIRADIHLNLFDKNNDVLNHISEYIELFAECFTDAKIARIGFIINFKLQKEDSLSIIRDQYIKEDKLRKTKELYIGWVNKLEVGAFSSNRLVNFNCNDYHNSDGNGIMMVDTNTLSEIQYDLKSTDIKDFVNRCIVQYQGDVNDFIDFK